MIYIQSIIITWKKEYRGGQKARIRNSIPESFELPLSVFARFNDDSIIIHEVRCDSYNNFVKTDTVSISGPEVKLKGALIKPKGEKLGVLFKYSVYDCGKPYRSKYDENGTLTLLEEKAFDLDKEEYGRIIFNGRYTDMDTGDWRYEKKIHNIIQSDTENKDIFIRNNVTYLYKQLALLK